MNHKEKMIIKVFKNIHKGVQQVSDQWILKNTRRFTLTSIGTIAYASMDKFADNFLYPPLIVAWKFNGNKLIRRLTDEEVELLCDRHNWRLSCYYNDRAEYEAEIEEANWNDSIKEVLL